MNKDYTEVHPECDLTDFRQNFVCVRNLRSFAIFGNVGPILETMRSAGTTFEILDASLIPNY